MRYINQDINNIIKPICKKKGFIDYKIISDWYLIIGKEFAAFTNPIKITQNQILYIEIYNSAMATQLHYMEPVILERIAVYFGYKAIKKLKLIHKPQNYIAPFSSEVAEPSETLKNLTKNIADEKLESALNSLGKYIIP